MKKLFIQLIENNPSEATVKLVYKCLYNEIIMLNMPPGSKMNLSKISNELNVSGTTVRDAAMMLLKDELVIMQSNQGFFVSNLNIKELRDIICARKIIEPDAAKLLCEKITNEQIEIFHNLLTLMDNAVNKGDYSEYKKLDEAFHRTIINFCGNESIILMYNSIVDTMKRYALFAAAKAYKKDAAYINTSFRQHYNIVKSLENSLIDNIGILIKNHIDNDERAINLHI
ncbi:MAG: GntR family transcriptional regulator [Eubacteriaceae bacterium]|nr:GntR family transcriptional regulator [Eubacteriaceae bacterium]